MKNTTPLCGTCGASPCYLICPTQCPFGGDQQAENAAYEAGAMYDDNRERYAATLADMEEFARGEEEAAREEYEAWAATPEGQAEIAARAVAEEARKAAAAARALTDDIPF